MISASETGCFAGERTNIKEKNAAFGSMRDPRTGNIADLFLYFPEIM